MLYSAKQYETVKSSIELFNDTLIGTLPTHVKRWKDEGYRHPASPDYSRKLHEAIPDWILNDCIAESRGKRKELFGSMDSQNSKGDTEEDSTLSTPMEGYVSKLKKEFNPPLGSMGYTCSFEGNMDQFNTEIKKATDKYLTMSYPNYHSVKESK